MVQPPSSKREHSTDIKLLFAARRAENDAALRKELSMKLWKALRKQRRQRQEDCLDDLTRRGAGARELGKTWARQNGVDRISTMRDNQGALQTDPDSICEVFAQFYEDLYKEHQGGSI